MAGENETVAETAPKVDEVAVKTDKEVIVEEEAAAEEKKEEKKDEEKKEEKKAEKPKKEPAPPVPTCHKKDWEQDVVYLFQFNRLPVLPSISPFCLKVESWLKLHGIKYENIDHKCKFRSKKGGMLPFIELNGDEVSDSDTIIATLAKKFEKEMLQLTPEQKNVQHAMVSMVENHLHWAIVYWRSKNHENMLKGYKMSLQTAIGSKLPASVLNFYFKYTYCRKGLKKVKAGSLGGYTPDEIEQFGKNDLNVLSEMLGDKEFFFGDEPAMLDLVVFSHVAQLAMVDKEYACPLRDYLMDTPCKNLIGLVNRMKDKCWGDHWDMATGEEMDLNPHIPKPEPPAPEPEKEEKEEEEKKEEEKETADEKKEDKEKVEEKEKDENKESEEKK